MNLSNLLSISLISSNGNEIEIETDEKNSIEFFIGRDRNLENSPKILGNISEVESEFNLHLINLNQINENVTISIHFEIFPFDPSLGYMFIYKFDQIPQLNSFIQNLDNWTIFCPNSK